MRSTSVPALPLLGLLVLSSGLEAADLTVVTLDSPAPLVQIRIAIGAGSAQDPLGLEGLAYLTGRLLIDGGFGSPKSAVSKEELAELTRPWGEGAYPRVSVSKEVTVFSMTVPRERLDAYAERVLGPLFSQPLFGPTELDRLRAETLQEIRSTLRLEQIELLGLVALDNLIHAGTSYAHPELGTERGLEKVTAEAVRRFFGTYYGPENVTLGLSTADPAAVNRVKRSLSPLGQAPAPLLARRAVDAPAPVSGRELLIVTMPNAISSGIHAGFPLPLTRSDPDYWPLYLANVWFGTHRDNFAHLYEVIRNQRGYNYGDYSYIEHFEARPLYQFPPPHYPRRHQYFSIWLRPVQHDYVHHLLKAMTWELESFVRSGLTDEEFELAKNKARVIYLNLAETQGRLLGSRLDDAFYGLAPGYLDQYLTKIDALTRAEVNAAVRKYLGSGGLRYLIVTDDEVAPRLAEEIARGGVAWGKTPADYQIEIREADGERVFELPESKLELVRRDAAWAHYWLDIPREKIHIVPSAKLFETAVIPNP
jgi:zinc protease